MQTLITVQEAETQIRKQLSTLPVETVSLLDAHGRFLREDLIADRPLPPFDRVMMDGIAICYESFADGQRHFPIEAIQAAGEPSRSLSSPDHCIEVMTGCALPSGCDCVIPVEEIEMCDQSATLIESCHPKHRQHIHPMGSDTPQGNQLLKTGTQLQAPELTIAASCGYTNINVTRLPHIHIISTGDELVAPHETPLPHQIRRSHATALCSAIANQHLGIVTEEHIHDSPDAIHNAIETSLEQYDVLILTGGVSKGKYDHVAPVLQNLLGDPHFHGIAQRPGKPMAFWSTTRAINSASEGKEGCKRAIRADDGAAKGREECKRTIFALPGNPVSVMACAARYLFPALTRILSDQWPEPMHLQTTGNFRCPSHFTGLVPSTLHHGKLKLHPASNSGNFLDLAGTHGVAELPGPLAGKELLNEPARFYPWT